MTSCVWRPANLTSTKNEKRPTRHGVRNITFSDGRDTKTKSSLLCAGRACDSGTTSADARVAIKPDAASPAA